MQSTLEFALDFAPRSRFPVTSFALSRLSPGLRGSGVDSSSRGTPGLSTLSEPPQRGLKTRVEFSRTFDQYSRIRHRGLPTTFLMSIRVFFVIVYANFWRDFVLSGCELIRIGGGHFVLSGLISP